MFDYGEVMKELFKYIFSFNIEELFYKPTTNFFIQFFRYVFVGGFAFLVDGGCLFLLESLGMNYLLATMFAFIVGLITNFILSKILVFKGNDSKKSNRYEFIIYAIVGVIGLGITELLMYLLTDGVGLYFMISKVIAAIIVLVWNFIGRKVLLYSDKKESE